MFKKIYFTNCAKTTSITLKDSVSQRSLSFASGSKSGAADNEQTIPIDYIQFSSDCSGCGTLGFNAVTSDGASFSSSAITITGSDIVIKTNAYVSETFYIEGTFTGGICRTFF